MGSSASTTTVITTPLTTSATNQIWVSGTPNAIYSASEDGNLLAVDVTAQVADPATATDLPNKILGYRLTIWENRVRANAVGNLDAYAIGVNDAYDLSGLLYDALINRMGVTQLRFPRGMIPIEKNSTYLFILSKYILYDGSLSSGTIKHVGGFQIYVEPRTTREKEVILK